MDFSDITKQAAIREYNSTYVLCFFLRHKQFVCIIIDKELLLIIQIVKGMIRTRWE